MNDNRKTVMKKKNRNYKKRLARRTRKTKKDAKKAIESGGVVVLVDEEVPLGAIAALGKGLGYVPTPENDILDERLEMRRTVNRILSESRKRCSEELPVSFTDDIPKQLRSVSYSLRAPAPDKQVNTLVDRLVTTHDATLLNIGKSKSRKSNLTKNEREGLKWLKDMSTKGKISIVQADKGGAILIVEPDLLERKVMEKLENPELYTKLEKDPTNTLKKELFELWKVGKTNKFISEKTAYEVAGVTENDNMSTHPRFKPGVAYYYPMLKIHKLRKEQLVPGVEPPARLVTSLREGIAKRSDVFIADQFLKALEKDFCKDLLVDSSDALRWLDAANENLSPDTKKTMNCFTFDFKALYDSIKPELVNEAVSHAMNVCRPDWSEPFKRWILSLIDFSLKASVAKYKDSWWKQNNGIPTGGSLCVQLANIVVFYVMDKKVYNDPSMMQYVSDVKRFIDDGVGFFFENEEKFNEWLTEVNRRIRPYGLYIDESSFKTNSEFINFLDIQYCFNKDGVLQTDLYRKETDSQAYLNFGSAHPNHTFSGNVYSQSLRLRRIINSQEKLKVRLDELAEAFKKAGYPKKMISNITEKVLNSERDISVKNKQELEGDEIVVVSTYEADEAIVKSVKESEENFKRTQSFRNQSGPLFKFVKKVGPNLKSRLNQLKRQALGTKRGKASMCGGRGCKTCQMLMKTSIATVGGKKIKLMEGSCKTKNVIYLAQCQICEKPYTGRTVDEIHNRNSGHRHYFKEILKQINDLQEIDTNSDLWMLGLHLHLDHGLTDPDAFDKHIKFGILDTVNPTEIEKKEFCWMHKINSFQPVGINIEYPFGIPFLGQN